MKCSDCGKFEVVYGVCPDCANKDYKRRKNEKEKTRLW
jgi:ribosomal protein L32